MSPCLHAAVSAAAALFLVVIPPTAAHQLTGAASLQARARTVSIALTKKTHRVAVNVDLAGLDTATSVAGKKKTSVVHKTAYFGTLDLGSQQSSFSVVFDTGSGNLIIPAEDCKSEACAVHAKFDVSKSTTIKEVSCDGMPGSHGTPGDEVTITFGTGEIWGKCYQDQICLGHLCHRGSFIAATFESRQPFKAFAFDGVLGLALPVMAQGPDFSMVSRMLEQNFLRQTLFSVFLSDSSLERSEINFGDIRHNHMASDLFWAPVGRDSGYWEVQIDDITFNDQLQGICLNCRVAVDTGTSELAGPSDIIKLLARKLNVLTDCSNYKDLPRLGFVIQGHILNLEPHDYVDKAGSHCDVSLMSLDVPPPKGPLFVFGIPFLQKFYTVYDNVNRKIGFAVAKHEEEPPKPLAMVELGSTRTKAS